MLTGQGEAGSITLSLGFHGSKRCWSARCGQVQPPGREAWARVDFLDVVLSRVPAGSARRLAGHVSYESLR